MTTRHLIAYLLIALLILAAAGFAWWARNNTRSRRYARNRARVREHYRRREATRPAIDG